MPKIHHGDEMGRNDVTLLSSLLTDGDTEETRKSFRNGDEGRGGVYHDPGTSAVGCGRMWDALGLNRVSALES